QEAIELFDRGELSGPALRRETGFQPEDAPETTEFVRWLLRKIATGSTDPSQTQAALKLLGADLGTAVAVGRNKPPPDDLRIDTEPNVPRRAIPNRDNASRRADRMRSGEGLAAACDVLVYRALERAGNRLKNLHPRTDTAMTAATEVYKTLSGDPDKLLAGAWDCAADVLEPYADDTASIVDTLDFYVRGLLGSKRPHSTVVLAALMNSRPSSLAVAD
ncbi:MAG TPA: hypothetical protein VIX41_10025, partial [Acidimicrobiales bacterium]